MSAFVGNSGLSHDVMLSMLSKGNTGNELMQILEVIAPDSEQQSDDFVYGQGNGYDPIDF